MARPNPPTALKLLRGGHKERINDDEPMPDDGTPECPSTNPDIVEVWQYTVRQLSRMRIVTMADRDALYAYCTHVVQFRLAQKMIERDGPIITGSHGGLQRHPATNTIREASAAIKAYSTVFGLTPGARAGIKVADQKLPAAAEAGAQRLLSS